MNLNAYLVGGAVRDELLGISPEKIKERDWVVLGETPESLKALGFHQVGKDFPVFLHPKTHEEYALARTERKIAQGHRGFDCFFDPSVTLEEDLLRRDLTVNAIAKNPHPSPLPPAGKGREATPDLSSLPPGETEISKHRCRNFREGLPNQSNYIDPFNGIADINARILRHVSPAFSEDPLRVLRVARFLAQLSPFNFNIAPETLDLIKTMVQSGELNHLSGERVFREIQKALESPAPEKFFTCLEEINAIPLLSKKPLLGRPLPKNSFFSFSLIQKFCWFFYNNINNLRFTPPTDFKEFGELLEKSEAFPSPADADISRRYRIEKNPKKLLEILDSLDVIRRPERFSAWAEFFAVFHQDLAPKEYLEEAAEALRKLNFQQIIQEEREKNPTLNPKSLISQAKEKALIEWLEK